jgi:AraC-like DNA-binding protein
MARRILKQSFSLLHIDYVKLTKKWNYTHVISPYIRIYFIDEGEGYISTAKGKTKLEKGYLYIIPSFTLCNLNCPVSLSQYFVHFFEDSPDGISIFNNCREIIKVKAEEVDITLFKRLLQINPGRKINRSDNPTVYERNEFYNQSEELNTKQPDAAFLETQAILLFLVSKFLNEEMFKYQNKNTVPSQILDCLSFIQVNLDKKIAITQLAKRANLQEDYFSRLFLKHTGERPLAYIQAKRIERAQYLTATTNMSFSKIAEFTGFDNLPYFFRIFKKVTQLTPAQYAAQNQSLNLF